MERYNFYWFHDRVDPDLSSASCLWHLSDESGLGNLSQLLVFPSEPKFLCPNTSVEREHSEMCPASPDRLLQAGRAPERLPLPIPGWHSLKTSIAHVKIKASSTQWCYPQGHCTKWGMHSTIFFFFTKYFMKLSCMKQCMSHRSASRLHFIFILQHLVRSSNIDVPTFLQLLFLNN